MTILQVEDTQTGKIVKFDWQEDRKPTQADLLAVFAENNRQAEPTKAPTDNMPWYQKAAIGVGKGMSDVNLGVMQKLLQGGNALGVVPKESLDIIQQDIQANRDAFKPLADQSTAANIGEFVGNTAPMLAIPGGVAGGALRRAGTSALAGGLIGGLQPTTANESSLQNAAIGTGAGGAMSGVLSGGGKAVNSLLSRLPANFREALSQKYNIPITLGESVASPNLQRVETGMERIPLIGLVGFRENQLKAADSAAKNAIGKYMVDPMATDVMDANRKFSSGLFKTLTDKVNQVSGQEIAPMETRLAATEMKDSLSDMFKMFQNTKREKLLKNIISDTNDKVAPTLNNMGEVIGMPTRTPTTLSFKDAWELRDSLGSLIGQAKKKLSGGDVDRTQLAEFSRLYGAVNKDIDNWIGATGRPDIKEAITSANDAYKHYVVKYNKIQDAYDSSIRIKDGEKSFIPERFSSEINKIIKGDKEYKSFSGSELEELDGLAKIMQVVNRAGKYKENLPTGDRWGLPISIGAGAGAVASPVATGATVGTLGLVRVLTGTEFGKRLLLSASKMESSNPNLQVLLKMGYNQIPKLTATEANRRK